MMSFESSFEIVLWLAKKWSVRILDRVHPCHSWGSIINFCRAVLYMQIICKERTPGIDYVLYTYPGY